MKKKIRTVALCAAMGLLTVGCQKENVNPSVFESVGSIYCVTYSIGGSEQTATVSEGDWKDFISHMFDIAEQGYTVSFFTGTYSPSAAKGTVTYTTSDRDDAESWAQKMVDDGYQVKVSYNPKSGIYTCVAIN